MSFMLISQRQLKTQAPIAPYTCIAVCQISQSFMFVIFEPRLCYVVVLTSATVASNAVSSEDQSAHSRLLVL